MKASEVMKIGNKKMLAGATAALIVLAMAAGCSSGKPTDSNGGGASAANAAATASAPSDATAASAAPQCTWSAADYSVDEEGMLVIDGAEPVELREHCLSCHGDADAAQGFDWQTVTASTEDWMGNVGFNPHDSHLAAVSCGACHQEGHALTIVCSECHYL